MGQGKRDRHQIYGRAGELIRSGAIGPVCEVHAWLGARFSGPPTPTDMSQPHAPPEQLPVPAGLNWDLWLSAGMNTQQLYQQRLNHYVTAMRKERPDRVPIRPFVAEFTAKYAGYTCQQVVHDYRYAFGPHIRQSLAGQEHSGDYDRHAKGNPAVQYRLPKFFELFLLNALRCPAPVYPVQHVCRAAS